MKSILTFLLFFSLICTPAIAVREFAQEYPTGRALEVYTKKNPPPSSGVNWEDIGGLQSDINLSGFTNDVNFVTQTEIDEAAYVQGTPWTGMGYITSIAPITVNGTNVGIGSSVPQQKLEVDGIIYSSGGIKFPDGSTQTVAATSTPPGGSSTNVQVNSSGSFYGNCGFVYVSPNVGIGTSSPSAMLEVEGNVYFGSGNVGIGSSAPQSNLEVSSATPTAVVINASASSSDVAATLTTLGEGGAGYYNYHIRTVLGGSRIADHPYTQYRVQFHAATHNNLIINDAYFGKRDTNTNFLAGKVRLLFSGANGTTIATNSTGWSDWVNFSGTGTEDLLVSVNMGNQSYVQSATPADGASYENNQNAGNDAAGAYNAPGNIYLVSGLEGRYSSATSQTKYQSSGTTLWTTGSDGSDANKFKLGTSDLTVGTVWTASGSNLGVGTVSPSSLLEVGAQKFNVLSGGNVGIGSTSPEVGFGVKSATGVGIGTSSVKGTFDIPASGNVGINSSVPIQRLDVNGSQYIHTNLGIGTSIPRQALDVNGTIYFHGGSLGIGTSIPRQALDLAGSAYVSTNVGINSSVPRQALDVNGTIYLHSGNLGIGTSIPRGSLDVDGNVYIYRGLLYFTQATAPTASDCGTSPVVHTGATNTVGEVTIGTDAAPVNSCTITFAASPAFSSAPHCFLQPESAFKNFYYTSTKTTLTIQSSDDMDSATVDWLCIDNSGG